MKTESLRVALVHQDIHQSTRGGICTVYRNLATQLVELGHEVVFVTQQTSSPLVPTKGISVVTLPRTSDLAAHRRAVAVALDGIDPDIVEASSWEAEVLDYALRPRDRRAPVVIRADLSARTMRLPHLAALEQQVIQAADAVAAVGRWTGEDIKSAYGVQAHVIPNGVDRGFFSPGPRTSPISSGKIVGLKPTQPRRGEIISSTSLADQVADTDALWNRIAGPGREHLPRMVWVGKATEMKGWDLLQQVVAAFRGKALFTVVIGYSEAHYDITLGGEPHVQILRDLSAADMLSLYRSADWGLSTSRWEGFHLSFAEKLRCGTAGLAPEHLGAAHDLITHGHNGLFFRDAEHLVALLAQEPTLRGSLAPEFDWAPNAAKTERLYAQVLTAKETN